MTNPIPVQTEQYAACVGASKRVRWDIDQDVLRGREFDTAHKFLPDSISGIDQLEFLSVLVNVGEVDRVDLQLARGVDAGGLGFFVVTRDAVAGEQLFFLFGRHHRGGGFVRGDWRGRLLSADTHHGRKSNKASDYDLVHLL